MAVASFIKTARLENIGLSVYQKAVALCTISNHKRLGHKPGSDYIKEQMISSTGVKIVDSLNAIWAFCKPNKKLHVLFDIKKLGTKDEEVRLKADAKFKFKRVKDGEFTKLTISLP